MLATTLTPGYNIYTCETLISMNSMWEKRIFFKKSNTWCPCCLLKLEFVEVIYICYMICQTLHMISVQQK